MVDCMTIKWHKIHVVLITILYVRIFIIIFARIKYKQNKP